METPPRTWGRLLPGKCQILFLRNTPTHVGKTNAENHGQRRAEKHPHARGEDHQTNNIVDNLWETPPRTWGRHRKILDPRWKQGNTPTHVGKTYGTTSSNEQCRKHPHARGEDTARSLTLGGNRETPPRTWGRLKTDDIMAVKYRNTPTHVGKTAAPASGGRGFWKHPHARGEDRKNTGPLFIELETPPRTWGRLSLSAAFMAARRNTPTHVGKTEFAEIGILDCQKHPHARGEDGPSLLTDTESHETPPRTWGRPIELRKKLIFIRNTPTHVGKTDAKNHRQYRAKKHPHARGEDAWQS